MAYFQHHSFIAYLKNYIANLPKRGRGELRRIAEHLKVSSTLVSQVLAAEKSFTSEQAHSLLGYLGLSGIEADYVFFLIQKDRAGSKDLESFWEAKLQKIRTESKDLSQRLRTDRNLSEEEKAILYSSHLYLGIWLFTSIGDKGKSLQDICDFFLISRKKANEILDFLLKCQLCSEKGSRFSMHVQKIHLERNSPYLLKHHMNWRMQALQKAEELSDEELIFSSPVSLSKKDFVELREKMAVFIREFLDSVHASPAEDLACFNLDFFWMKNK